MREARDCEHVQPMHLVLALWICIDKVTHGSESGIINQQAEIRRFADSCGYSSEGFVVSEVRSEDFRANVILLADLVGDRLQAVFTAGDQQKVVAARSKFPGERRAKPAGGSCDDSQHLSPFPRSS